MNLNYGKIVISKSKKRDQKEEDKDLKNVLIKNLHLLKQEKHIVVIKINEL
jgi:hypothetical protein